MSDLSFDAGGFNAGDFVTVSAFGAMDELLSSFNISSNGNFGFGGLGGISRIFFDDSSTGAGFGFGNFSIDQTGDGTTAIPVPATLVLLLSAFGVSGLAFRRSAA